MDPARSILYNSNMNSSSRIHNYNLFGETAELADVLHVETIRARSELHDWQLKPHRHAGLHQLLFLTHGGGTAEFDGISYPLQEPCLANIPRRVVHGYQFRPGSNGWVVTLTCELLDHCLQEGEGVRSPLETAGVVPLHPAMLELARSLFEEYHRQDFARAQVLRSLAGALSGLTARAMQEAADAEQSSSTNPLFAHFEQQVERDFRSRKPLSDYARDLAISPTHLNRVVRQATGQPASTLINERMLREARRLLIYTNLTAAQIAYELGFSDPAHFSRVFAKGSGVAPVKFRQRQSKEGRGDP
ncbi:transcriptional regulatory protein [Roseobacter sp. SK209-2-6]|nr:transcriptional regulatory protein [Roseobacter sp. SK209-2-6]